MTLSVLSMARATLKFTGIRRGRPKPAARRYPPQFERLEDRYMLDGSEGRSPDGAGISALHSECGSTDQQPVHSAPAAYADGISTSTPGAFGDESADSLPLLASAGDEAVTAQDVGMRLVSGGLTGSFGQDWGSLLDALSKDLLKRLGIPYHREGKSG